ncbi:drug/metabolite transporter (DMT)-like permease [Lewinella antarctica]|uniref:Drug/metabolite transporter (DMT)-like permease n=2 Tax=Neolewinella antarctica TaxID=442734 RepID=A0ABX0XF42_9BACT|nr:drug/metabolite transporter (DMT)-like permease [Neolewinella antarctica]
MGDWIQLSALTLVWWRVLITSVALAPFIRPRALLADLGRKQLLIFAGLGVLVVLHWVTFYGAIKLANASVGLICLATTSLWSSLIEPFVMRRPVNWFETSVGLLILPGIYLIADGVDPGMTDGIIVGLVSAILVSFFTVYNKKYVEKTDPLRIVFLELGAGTLFLTLFLPFFGGQFWPSPVDWMWLVILALLCTIFTNWLFLRALRELSAFAANLTVNLEAVYGILLAYFLLDDAKELEPTFYVGTAVIIVAVFGYAIAKRVLRGRAK